MSEQQLSEQWVDEPSLGEPSVDEPSDEDLYGHLDQPLEPIPAGGIEGDALEAEAAWERVRERDWSGAGTVFDALAAFVAEPGLPPGIHDAAPVDLLPAGPGEASTYCAIVRLDAERYQWLAGPFEQFGAAVVPLHDAAKRFRTQHLDAPGARAWIYAVVATPARLGWVLG